VQAIGPAQEPCLLIQQQLLSAAATAAAEALVKKLGLQLQQVPVRTELLQKAQQQQLQQQGKGVLANAAAALAAAAAAIPEAAAALPATAEAAAAVAKSGDATSAALKAVQLASAAAEKAAAASAAAEAALLQALQSSSSSSSSSASAVHTCSSISCHSSVLVVSKSGVTAADVQSHFLSWVTQAATSSAQELQATAEAAASDTAAAAELVGLHLHVSTEPSLWLCSSLAVTNCVIVCRAALWQ
jgi:hypothetical protein